MKKPPKKLYVRYTKEVKLEAIRRVLDGDEPVQQIIEDLGIRHRDNVYEWIKKYNKYGEAAFDRKLKANSNETELNDLKEEVEILRAYIGLNVQDTEGKFQAVEQLNDRFPVESLCKVFNITVKEFNQAKKQPKRKVETPTRIYRPEPSRRVFGR